MNIFKLITKIVVALAAVAGAVYVVATYGDKIVAWAKKIWASLPKCECCDCDCDCECDCECDENCECECECTCQCTDEPVAEEVAEAVEEVVEEIVEEVVEAAEELVADEADFEA